MGLTEVLARCEDEAVKGTNGLVTKSGQQLHHQRVPSHSRESSTSSTTSTASCAASSSSGDSDAEPVLLDDPSTMRAGMEVMEARLEETRLELERSRAECGRLAQIRDDVEAEVRELTASLFQEAHIMVNAANVKAAASEKALKEARMQVEVLSAEVDALKTLVLTSTPSQPNPHLHPQLSSSLSSSNIQSTSSGFNHKSSSYGTSSGGLKMFTRHRRGASDCDLKYAPPSHQGDGVSSLSSSPENGTCASGPTPSSLHASSSDGHGTSSIVSATLAGPGGDAAGELDPILYEELESWRRKPSLERNSSALMKRLFEEDADRCLDFPCSGDLSARVRRAVEDNSIYIEEFISSSPQSMCALFNTRRVCRYRIKLGDGEGDGEWYYISSLGRNRITAVCDTLTYLRYIKLGLVKSPMEDVYWEVMRLRKHMTLARLGLS